ncbi:MAG TPA: M15 family metallopeptidase [Acidimicrobiia bacterium]|nr:M15 family metallopeptidase [Acidimicrobiia bacterium]
MRFLRFTSILAILSSTMVAHAAPVTPDYVPIAEEALTDDLAQAGYHNGDMPGLRMIEVDGCLLERDAAYTLSLMLEAARADGMDLEAQECYRSYGSQAAAYERRCPVEEEEITKPDPVTGEEIVIGVKKTRSCSGPPLALPGRSNHGWGRAVDFGNGSRVLSCSDAAFVWLQENGGSFGWVHPDWAQCGRSTREPWHWEWGGVTEALPLPPVLRTFSGSDTRVR